MDEILAQIRKIISDEPAAAKDATAKPAAAAKAIDVPPLIREPRAPLDLRVQTASVPTDEKPAAPAVAALGIDIAPPMPAAPVPPVDDFADLFEPDDAKSEPAVALSAPTAASDLPPVESGERAQGFIGDDAMESALGALAAGLAARTVAAEPEAVAAVGVDTMVEAAPTAAVSVEPESEPLPEIEPPAPADLFSAPAASTKADEPVPQERAVDPAEPVAVDPAVQASLEDSMAELLRPMLRQWLDTNMPRIVERALRVEMAELTQPRPPSKRS
jgi:cell pole-organizing protein PopZ